MVFDNQEEHPAFGMISLSRVHGGGGGGVNLYGSSVKHNTFISLRIDTSTRSHDLHHDHYFSRSQLIEVWLSPVQLAEMLTSMNTSGVPCTLRSYRGPSGKFVIPGDCPATSKAEKIYKEFQEQTKLAAKKMRAVEARLRELEELGKPVGKKELQRLRIQACVAAQEVDANMPFIGKSFDEKVQETVRDAKGEIEAFVSMQVHASGVKALGGEAPELLLDALPEKEEEETS